MERIEEIIVLFDKSSQGKTSTLRELIRLLAGSLPTSKGDIRAIIRDYKAKNQRKRINIFIATCGDTPFVIEDNIRFFNSKIPDNISVPIYIFDAGSWVEIKNLAQIENIQSNICISACRSDGVGVDAMHYFINANLSYTFVSMWIRLKTLRSKLGVIALKRKTPNWTKLAQEMKDIIDEKFAKNRI